MFRVHVKHILTDVIIRTFEVSTKREALKLESDLSMDLDYEHYYTEIEGVPKK